MFISMFLDGVVVYVFAISKFLRHFCYIYRACDVFFAQLPCVLYLAFPHPQSQRWELFRVFVGLVIFLGRFSPMGKSTSTSSVGFPAWRCLNVWCASAIHFMRSGNICFLPILPTNSIRFVGVSVFGISRILFLGA